MSLAPPVEKDGFAYAGDVLYAESSNHSRHRRATQAELKELFRPEATKTSSAKDPTGHWFEAQLIHYGLPPSKTKSVAKTRLLDAFNKGNMAVPQHIQRLETALKKEWNKKEKQALKEKRENISSAVAALPQSSTASGKKRKGQDEETPKPVAKKANATKSVKSAVSSKLALSEKSSKSKPTGSGKTTPSARGRRAKPSNPGNRFDSRPRLDTAGPSTIPPVSSIPKQTARRSRPPIPGHRFDSRPHPQFELDEDASVKYESSTSYDTDEEPTYVEEESSPPPHSTNSQLGLINGRYICETNIDGEWSEFDGHQSTIILTLHGDQIWGAYDLGMFNGVFCMAERPYVASSTPIDFHWRGVENGEGEVSYDDYHQTSDIAFLGDGIIAGSFIGLYGKVEFQGRRASGQGTRSERDFWSLKNEWDSYSEDAYDQARVGRWR